MRGFLNGVVFTIALLVAAAVSGVLVGALPSGADSKPLPMEKLAANVSLRSTIARETRGVTNPLQPTSDNLVAGVKLYGANCAVCHGTSDGKASKLAQGFYIKSPQLATDGVEDDPAAVTHWKVVHGIRFSAMPSFKGTLSDDELWKITMFVKAMDKLPPAADAEWKKLPSAAVPTT